MQLLKWVISTSIKAQDDHDKLVKDKSEVLRNGDDLIQFLNIFKKSLSTCIYKQNMEGYIINLVYLREEERRCNRGGEFSICFLSFQSFIHVVTCIVFEKNLKKKYKTNRCIYFLPIGGKLCEPSFFSPFQAQMYWQSVNSKVYAMISSWTEAMKKAFSRNLGNNYKILIVQLNNFESRQIPKSSWACLHFLVHIKTYNKIGKILL